MKKVSEQPSTLKVLAITAVGAFAFLFAPVISLSPALAQQITNTTAVGGIPEITELPPQLLMTAIVVDNQPFYQSTSSNVTSMRIVDVSPSGVTQEVSFVEKAFMRNIGNVTNAVTFVDNITRDGRITIVHGAGKGIITTENGDTISWNSYGLGLPAGYGNRNNNDTSATIASGGLNTDRITTYRGIAFFSTDSERLSFMNNVVGLYISQVNDENGSSWRQIWEWKNNY